MAANLADMYAAITLANIDVHQRMIVLELKDQIAQKAASQRREPAHAHRSIFAPPSLTRRRNCTIQLEPHTPGLRVQRPAAQLRATRSEALRVRQGGGMPGRYRV